MIGLGGLGAEIAKNLTLAGVDSMTLMDDRSVEEVDFTSNFFLNRSATDVLGRKIAEGTRAEAEPQQVKVKSVSCYNKVKI